MALLFYPFFSRCIHAFDASPIGNGEGSEVSPIDWSAIEDMCFPQEYRHRGVTMTYQSLNELELTASIATYLFLVWLLASLPSTHYDDGGKAKRGQESEVKVSWRNRVNRWFRDRPVVAAVALFCSHRPVSTAAMGYLHVEEGSRGNV
ncbi:uncharacterized protein B0J16DRAFT_158549 [Fusarium flagelliforme]|uniref:uncharacterized protein n=1 Tax=Fusarium flagelliforme TaxID=2675880 RepID=UPI001E8EE29D|nr:uncharacterized protein B0J16DRAFT_158549 [Fusarium flagelliforme]KAH7182975.1 hypothetical protein B0J16DRAFT_158549 [Fusarium flagelliforme]